MSIAIFRALRELQLQYRLESISQHQYALAALQSQLTDLMQTQSYSKYCRLEGDLLFPSVEY